MNVLKGNSLNGFLSTLLIATSACATSTPLAETQPGPTDNHITEYDYYDRYDYGFDQNSDQDDWFYDYYDTRDLFDPVTDYDYGWAEDDFGWDDDAVFETEEL